VVSEAAVKQHLAHLYDKFGISDGGERRRVRLANEALRRGAVTIALLRKAAARDDKQAR
jgi:DNA-binding NarL/FixJ family response regulator